MRAVIQKVKNASVSIGGEMISCIDHGILILLGITHDDDNTDIEWLAKKIIKLRIFDDQDSVMNLSLEDIGGDVLVVSQFTLLASTKKGNRPSYTNAARPAIAEKLYEDFITYINNEFMIQAKTGIFGAEMQVQLTNTGPVTIIIDSKSRE